MMVLSRIILLLFVLVGVAFLTLLERKVLGYIQLRVGPNKPRLGGILQPMFDAVKLFTKEQTIPTFSNFFFYYLSPVFSLFLSLVTWLCIPYLYQMYSINLGVLYFICCTSMGVYSIMISGWSSNSVYSLLGSLRSVAQTISYEVRLRLIFIRYLLLILSLNFHFFQVYQNGIWFVFLCLPLRICWFRSSLAETNRTPFDFAEGESELVSGFNVEYRRGGFALIFLAEYSRILFIRMLFVLIFLGGNILIFTFYLKLGVVSFLFIWVRGCLPRFRYDKLINLAWKVYLPLSLNIILYFLGLLVIRMQFN